MENLIDELRSFINDHGKWSAHNIYIKDNVYTISESIINDEYKLNRIIQNLMDITHKKINELRILDLACLEGLFGLECARQGADVTFLDIRDTNLQKVEFIANKLELSNVSIIKDDVRNISGDKYGKFDVIFCFGIFYHLDKNDLYNFVSRMYDMCEGFVFFDTHITHKKSDNFISNGKIYHGWKYKEHRSDITEEEMNSELWKSYINKYSFIMSKTSFVCLLNDAGFTSVLESLVPFDRTKNTSRISIIAIKGEKSTLISAPLINTIEDIPPNEFSLLSLLKQYIKNKYNDVIYNLKLSAPKIVRDFYKKNIKHDKDYKKLKKH